MGIRKLFLALTIFSVSAGSFADDSSKMQTIFRACEQVGGDIEKVLDGEKNGELCYKLKCGFATSNASETTISSVKAEFPAAEGALAGSWVRVCVPGHSTDSLLDQHHGGGSGGGKSDVSVNGNGGGGGSINGGGGGGHINGGGGGGINVNGNGPRIVQTTVSTSGPTLVRTGGRATRYSFESGGMTYYTVDEDWAKRCLKKTWFSAIRKKKYTNKLKKECKGDLDSYVVSGSGIDSRIGNDIDLNGGGSGTITLNTGGGGGRSNNGGGSGRRGNNGGTINLNTGNNSGVGGGGYYTINVNGRSVQCRIGVSAQDCIGNGNYGDITSRRGDAHICIDCQTNRSRQGSGASGILNGIANITGALAPSLFGYLGQRSWSKAYQNVGVANANALATGYEQCQLSQTNYVQNTYAYLQANELPDRTVEQPDCNGYNLGSFSGGLGYGGSFGSFGSSYSSAGYSTGLLGAMQGPYGSGYLPGFNVTGGSYNPSYGLYGNSPYGNNGLNAGINLGLGNTGYNPYGNNGLAGGINLGLGNTGYNPYGNTGLNAGINLGLGNTGYNPYGNIGLNTGYNPYGNTAYNPTGLNLGVGFNSSPSSYGLTGWPSTNTGSYYSNTNPAFQSAWNGGINNGVNANAYYSAQQSLATNAQAGQIGYNYQSAALQNQYNTAAQNLNNHYSTGYNTGSAGYSPSNLGLGLSAYAGFRM